MLKFIDLPPVWLALFIAVAWGVSPGAAGAPWAQIGGLLVLAGIGLILWAALVFARARTTIIPHRRASALVTHGPFRLSRNPIYLADALILAGLLLRWDLAWALPSVALLMWIIATRFIVAEEARLTQDFPEAFAAWSLKTRRWL
ncbi:MAG: isoprenylcysteine carboxylmethyltransferase family protein [Pseudomonadota bacterium]